MMYSKDKLKKHSTSGSRTAFVFVKVCQCSIFRLTMEFKCFDNYEIELI